MVSDIRTGSHSDSPRMSYPPRAARVMGERNTKRPADARRETRALPILPRVTPNQLARHPKRDAYSKPHAHRTDCSHTVRCDGTGNHRSPVCVSCSPPTEPSHDLGGRKTPQHFPGFLAKGQPDPVPGPGWSDWTARPPKRPGPVLTPTQWRLPATRTRTVEKDLPAGHKRKDPPRPVTLVGYKQREIVLPKDYAKQVQARLDAGTYELGDGVA